MCKGSGPWDYETSIHSGWSVGGVSKRGLCCKTDSGCEGMGEIMLTTDDDEQNDEEEVAPSVHCGPVGYVSQGLTSESGDYNLAISEEGNMGGGEGGNGSQERLSDQTPKVIDLTSDDDDIDLSYADLLDLLGESTQPAHVKQNILCSPLHDIEVPYVAASSQEVSETAMTLPAQQMDGSQVGILSGHQSDEQSMEFNADDGSGYFPSGTSAAQSLYNIDHARPSQNYGSVLASETRFKGSISALEAAGVVDGTIRNSASPMEVGPQYDVVDLTGDSDGQDTVEVARYVEHGGLTGKRRVQGHLESDRKRRLNNPGGHSGLLGREDYDHNTSISRSRMSASLQTDNWMKLSHPLGKNAITMAMDSFSNQIPQTWNCGGSQFSLQEHTGLLHNQSGRLVGGKSPIPFGLMHESSVKRVLPVSLGCPASMLAMQSRQSNEVLPGRGHEDSLSGQSFQQMQGSLAGTHKEESTPDDGLLSVPLLKHQRLALAWMEKRESLGEIPRGGILADDQGLGKTISTISLILKARAPVQKKSVEAMNSSHSGALMIELVSIPDDDDDCKTEGRKQKVVAQAAEKPCNRLPQTISNGEECLGFDKAHEDTKSGLSKSKPAAGNLVVCPTSVLRQWSNELKEKVTDEAGLSVLIYHGSNRTRDPDELARYDVVLTTYSIVSMEVPKQPLPDNDKDKRSSVFGNSDVSLPFNGALKGSKARTTVKSEKKGARKGKGRFVEGDNGSVDAGPLARVHWFRVILDEAQSIKNARTQVARAAWGLRAKRRWCLSGTPIQNAIDDLYSYFRFLRYSPFDAYKVFREKIKDPITRSPQEGCLLLSRLLLPVMLRRTKGSKTGVQITKISSIHVPPDNAQWTLVSCASLIDGQPIVNLPPRIVTLKQTEFNDEERAFYNSLEAESRRMFQDYTAAGTLQSNYVNMLWMLLRLRQACDHPLLVQGRKSQGPQKDILESARRLPAEQRMDLLKQLEFSRAICPICNDLPDEAVICICTHIFCRQCISEQLASGDDTSCPTCRKSLNTSLIFTLSSLKNCELGEKCSGDSPLILEGNQLEEWVAMDDVGWKSSSKIDAVIDTLSRLPTVYVVIENGKVVVEASKDLEDVKLVDASSLSIVGCEPVGNSALVSGAKPEPDSADILDSTQNIGLTSNIKIVKLAKSEPDMASKSRSVTRNICTAVKAVKYEPTDIVIRTEPVARQIVESTEKAIVFSQWTSMLDLLEVRLKQAKFNYRRLDGTMSVLARDRAVSEFKSQPEVTVIIMSLKAASLGLNMVAACHVLLLDVWWNPTTEDQAIDRAHRIGQTRTVNVSRFTVKNTIEDRILELQEKKRKLVARAFGEDDRGGGQKSGLTQEDFRYLFGGKM